MEKLLRKINETFDNCIQNSNDETKLQLRIIKNNINALFNEYEADSKGISIGGNKDIRTITSTPIQSSELALSNDKNSILIIDDSSLVRNYLEKIFSEEYNVKLAVDGQDAINQISDDNFIKGISLILLDLMMPNVDGFGVLDYLMKNNINIPVMIISGDNSKETINKAFQYNVADIIEKPFDAKKIREKISRFINL